MVTDVGGGGGGVLEPAASWINISDNLRGWKGGGQEGVGGGTLNGVALGYRLGGAWF